MPAASIEAVSFDVGGTLMDPWPSVGHVYATVAAEHGHPQDPAVLNQAFARCWTSRQEFNYSEAAWQQIVEQTFAGLLSRTTIHELFPSLYDRFKDRASWQVYPEVVPVLRQLKSSGLKLAVISNWDTRLRRLLQVTELLPWFDACIISAEVGWAKPGREIFCAAAEQLALPVRRLLHVGDSATEDVAGALAAGCQAVLLNRRSAAGPGNDWIRQLSELPGIVGR